jgi:rod shape-determining protein MreD
MAEAVERRVWAYRGVFVLIAGVALFLKLLPLGAVPSSLPWPDLLLCLTMAWVLRRPEYLPAMMIAAIYLLADFLLMRPPGIWALMVLLGTEFLRSRSTLTRELSFVMEWVMVAGVLAAMVLGMRFVLAVAMVAQAPIDMTLAQLTLTILAYPLVVVVSSYGMNVHKPATGEVDAMGRRL